MAEYLSEHFTRYEFEHSDTAIKYNIKNIMNDMQLKVAKHTCQYLLEPLRNELAKIYNQKVYIHLNSGFRSEALNIKLKGATNSQHKTCEAVDCYFYTLNNSKKNILYHDEVYNHIKNLVKNNKISVDQCILEKSGNSIWVHLSHSSWGKTKDRKQFLKYNNGKYTLDK